MSYLSCDVCQRKSSGSELEFMQISIFKQGWVCDTCRQEIKEQLEPNEVAGLTEASMRDFESRN